MTNDILFKTIGFNWDRTIIPTDFAKIYTPEQTCMMLKRMLPDYVFDVAVMEGNEFTYPEVKTLLEGVTVGGHKISDHDQIMNIAEGLELLRTKVKNNTFTFDKATFCEFQNIFGQGEALECGHFRGEGDELNYTPDVGLGLQGRYTPIATEKGAPLLNNTWKNAKTALNQYVKNPLEKGVIFFLHGAMQQYFFDANKRSSRAMMNGILMSNGIEAITIPAVKRQEFNEKMVNFYISKNGTEMIKFMCGLTQDLHIPTLTKTLAPPQPTKSRGR
jgi:Fic family protein